MTIHQEKEGKVTVKRHNFQLVRVPDLSAIDAINERKTAISVVTFLPKKIGHLPQ